jgi:hypothetical protein
MKKILLLHILFLNFHIFIFSSAHAQNYAWAKSVGSTDVDFAQDIVVDANGNTYITGSFTGTADFDPGAGTAILTSVAFPFPDIFFAKYDASGNYIWAKSIGSYANDYGRGIVLDGSGNLYIIGAFEWWADFDPGPDTAILTPTGGYDIYFGKYDTSGNYIWAKNVGGTEGDHGYDIAVDASGSFYVTGVFQGTADFDPSPDTAFITVPGGQQECFFAKYDTSGNYLWAKGIVGSSNGDGSGIAVDDSGNTYITGKFTGTADFDPGSNTVNLTSVGDYDIFFAGYDSSGNYLWAKNVGSTGTDYGTKIAMDGSGNTYITGVFQGTADFDPGVGIDVHTSIGNSDIFFAKYDATGNYIWAKNIGSVGGDYGNAIAVDGNGSTYITGAFQGTADFDPGVGTAILTSGGVTDIFFAKYDPLGNYLWANNIGSVGDNNGAGVAVDGSGNTFITGHFSGTTDFDPDTGTTTLTSTGEVDIYFARYDSLSIITANNEIENFGSSFFLFPNPATDRLMVEFKSCSLDNYSLLILDATGRVVIEKTGVALKNANTLELDISFLSKGIYSLCFTSNDGMEQRKIVIQ